MKEVVIVYFRRWIEMMVPLVLLFFTGCQVTDPQKEDVPELITKVILTFSPSGGGETVIVEANDPDGEGIQSIKVNGTIYLKSDIAYTMTIQLINGLADPSDPEYDITHEVRAEGQEHIFFFAWTNNVFSNPAGNGNIDNRSDEVNYSGGSDSVDTSGRPLGLTTSWTTTSAASGALRILLKHQPNLKSDTSDANTGETDLDLSFPITVQ